MTAPQSNTSTIVLLLASAMSLPACEKSAGDKPASAGSAIKAEPTGAASAAPSSAASAAPSSAASAAPSSAASAVASGTASAPAADGMLAIPKVDEAKPEGAALSAYRIDKHEVTAAQYQGCVDAGACKPQKTVQSESLKPLTWNAFCNLGVAGREQHPMNCVDWNNADAYCKWAGKRLPTEAELAHIAFAGKDQKYPWGDAEPTAKLLNACDTACKAALKEKGENWGSLYPMTAGTVDDGFVGTAPVGSYPDGAASSGALDVAGNVWEWTADWYSPSMAPQPSKQDPTGPASGSRKTMRGGSWNDFRANMVDNKARFGFLPVERFANAGFRCAQSAAAK
ncbi:MAG: SUMF1/EgtB/PvdO family nonheme iron enzyme [Deltaproteobacteria bacterium]|nr:SUMF1/EgtB/PvdO family nonheme iron enzyme [Deltaproteobacteria bacterium]